MKCHLVGDYAPAGSLKALAPQLERVHERLRPDYAHGWIANPKRYLPYTGMPVNIPYDKPVSQDLYVGDSEQQLGALTDLLMHYDEFTKRQFSLEPYLPQAASPPAEEQAREEAAGVKPAEPKASGEQARTGEQVKTGEQVSVEEPSSSDLTAVGNRVDSVGAQKIRDTDPLTRNAKAYGTGNKIQIEPSL